MRPSAPTCSRRPAPAPPRTTAAPPPPHTLTLLPLGLGVGLEARRLAARLAPRAPPVSLASRLARLAPRTPHARAPRASHASPRTPCASHASRLARHTLHTPRASLASRPCGGPALAPLRRQGSCTAPRRCAPPRATAAAPPSRRCSSAAAPPPPTFAPLPRRRPCRPGRRVAVLRRPGRLGLEAAMPPHRVRVLLRQVRRVCPPGPRRLASLPLGGERSDR